MSAPSLIAGVMKKHQPKENRDQSPCSALVTPDFESNIGSKDVRSHKLPLVSYIACILFLFQNLVSVILFKILDFFFLYPYHSTWQ